MKEHRRWCNLLKSVDECYHIGRPAISHIESLHVRTDQVIEYLYARSIIFANEG